MDQRMHRLKRFAADEEAATAVEYSIMVVLIILVCVATIAILGGRVDQAFNTFITEYNKLVS